MAEQQSECLIHSSSNNNKSGGIPTEPMKTKFDLPPEKYEEFFRKRRIREREEKKQEFDDGDEETEEYKAYTANMTKCLVKPRLGHEAWWRYRDYLATQKAAATSVYHDDDEAPGPKKKLTVNEEEAVEGGDHETSTKKENMNRVVELELMLS